VAGCFLARESGLRTADDPVKTTKLIAVLSAAFFAALSGHAQSFENLNLEQANPVIDPSGPYYPLDVTAASALPDWTAYLGSVQQTDVIQNAVSTGQASVVIFGPDYPAAGSSPGFYPGTIDGNYSVLLQAGADPITSALEGASIAQYGTVPLAAQSLEFKAWETPFTEFSVSFDGNTLSPLVLGSGANYTLYGVNISSYDGDSGTLQFSALFVNPGVSWLGLDDISFVPVPEPNIVALTAIGGLLFGARKRFARR
jgi:hypothetical protein